MTGGRVVVLGEIGLNVGAGMSGGDLYVLDPEGRLPLRLNTELVVAERAAPDSLRELVELHLHHTGSPRAAAVLERWDEHLNAFWHVAPRSDVSAQDETSEEPLQAQSSPSQ
jgi:glutamate synthase (ferredoxin)